ncbi:O-antigen ligase family protein [[Clostridium] hylemonae]|uniref:O-antigen ligase family protein n=1 Tax=[Clostridium] hylemonae TaxID=89153 RepID=UPI001FCB6359|nr:O-antigen ligase family protein [[Clostridium] hylemonae]
MFLAVSILQYFLFYTFYRPGLNMLLGYTVKVLVLYICIFIVFFMVKYIQLLDKERFERQMSKYIIIMGIILALFFMLFSFDKSFLGNIQLDNQNNYGCYICAVTTFLLIKCKHEKSIICSGLILFFCFLLFINDSKAALFGVIIQIGIFFCISGNNGKKKIFVFRRYIVPVFLIIILLGILIINPSINEYPLRSILLEPVRRIIENDPYSVYASSTKYRTNTTIFALSQLWKTGGFGVGPGNTGILLKQEFPSLNPSYTQALNSPSLAMHNAWLEFALDVGIIAIAIMLMVLVYACKLYFTKRHLSQIEELLILFCLSFPVWVISASGIYTQYYLMIIMAFLVFSDKNKECFKIRR